MLRLLIIPLLLSVTLPAFAQEDLPTAQKFGDGEITFARGEDEEITVSYKDREIYRNYYVSFERTVTLAGVEVALLSGGDGGNACGPASLILTQPADSPDPKLDVIDDCGAPEPAVTSSEIYYVPYLKPGAKEPLKSWSPESGLVTVGELVFQPKAGTTWANLDPKSVDGPWSLFDNAEIYAAARQLMGDRFDEVITGLSVSGTPALAGGRFLTASGCAPHACGGQNGFVGIDLEKRQIYAASRISESGETFWPADPKSWPPEILSAYKESVVE